MALTIHTPTNVPNDSLLNPSFSLPKSSPSYCVCPYPHAWKLGLKPFHSWFKPLTNERPRPAHASSSSIDSTQESSPQIPVPNKNKDNGDRKSIWVNPKMPKASASLLQKYGNNLKYVRLKALAQRLDACEGSREEVSGLLGSLGDQPDPKEAVFIINNLQSWEKAYLAFQYFKAKEGFSVDLILYNVTMKLLRKGRQWDLVEQLVEQLVGEGMKPDNFTFSTVISCARQCNLPHKAVEWFERINGLGCAPDEITFSAMIDSYGRAGKISEALNMYEKAAAQGWRLHTVTFATLIRMYYVAGSYQAALNTYEEMKAFGVKPNRAIYNTMLDAMGRSARPWHVKSLHNEMMQAAISPNRVTFSALIRAYGKARWPDDAFHWFGKMKEAGWEMDTVLYNILLSMCADMGRVDDAFRLFREMSESENCKPDNWSYTSMILIYTNMGQVSEAEKMLNEMLVAGYKPTLFPFTSLIQGLGKRKRFDDVIRVFDQLLQAGLSPDERLCGCLLSVLTLCGREEEFGKVLSCIHKANSELASVAKLLTEEAVDIEVVMQDLRAVLTKSSQDVRKPYCNCLIDLCRNFNFVERAHELLQLGTSLEVYSGLQSKTPTEWSLNLKTLSLGAAITAFQNWVSVLSKALEDAEELPPLIGIHTGHGMHKFSHKGLATAIESHLREVGAPFQESPDRVGWFLTTGVAVTLWLQSRNSSSLSPA